MLSTLRKSDPSDSESEEGRHKGGNKYGTGRSGTRPESMRGLPEEVEFYEATAKWAAEQGALEFDEEGGLMVFAKSGPVPHLRKEMIAEANPRVGAYVAIALGSLRHGASEEEWKRSRMQLEKELRVVLGKKGVNSAVLTERHGGFAVFRVLDSGECPGGEKHWYNMELVDEAGPFGKSERYRVRHTVTGHDVSFFMVLREGGELFRQAAKTVRKREKARGAVSKGECVRVHVSGTVCSECGEMVSGSGANKIEQIRQGSSVGSRKRRLMPRRGATAEGGDDEDDSSSDVDLSDPSSSEDDGDDMKSSRRQKRESAAVPIASHLKEFVDNDGVPFSVSKGSLLEERKKEAQIVARMVDPMRRTELIRDGVVDYEAWYLEWTAPLTLGSHELRRLDNIGVEVHDYSRVSQIFDCRIIKKERFTMAVKGMWLPIMDMGSNNNKGGAVQQRSQFINCDDFIANNEEVPGGGEMNLTARNWLGRLAQRMEDFHVSLYGETYKNTFSAVAKHLEGPTKEDFTLAYVAGSLELGVMSFYKMAAANHRMRWLSQGATPPTEGYHQQMAAQLRAAVDGSMRPEGLKHQYPHVLFWNRWEPMLGRIGDSLHKKSKRASPGSEDGGDAGGQQAPTEQQPAKRAKKHKTNKRENVATAAAAATATTAAAAAAGVVVGSPAGSSRQTKAAQPCMNHVLVTTGLSKVQCPHGESCKFGHWKRGRLGEADIAGVHWEKILTQYPTLRTTIKAQHVAGSH
jgi:hypothetical protein